MTILKPLGRGELQASNLVTDQEEDLDLHDESPDDDEQPEVLDNSNKLASNLD